jgi:hypothetical protein
MSRSVNGRHVCRALVGILVLGFISSVRVPASVARNAVQAQAAMSPQPLSADDVSWLFPAPTGVADLDKLISVGDLTAANQDPTKRDPIWSDTVFQRFLGIAASDRAQVAGTHVRIGLPPEAQSIRNWFVAGIRIDPGAPGLSDDIRGQFGQSPQIRLVVQPVRRNAGSAQALDVAAHLVFDFTLPGGASAQPGCSPLFVPDPGALTAIVTDASTLRTRLANGEFGNKITTAELPLGVHPGLVDPNTGANVAKEMKAFLERHISASHLNAMAVMGTPANAPEPWIFLAMANVPRLGGFIAVPSPTLDGQQSAQMLELAPGGLHVTPAPNTNNLNPVTCKNAAVPTANIPVSDRLGVATSELFLSSRPSDQRIMQVLERIGSPTQSHFFNTDCVSCHTDTQRAISLLHATTTPGVDRSAFQSADWNVRNFGWGPESRPTATRRTAAETAAVVTFINSKLLGK